MIKRGGKAHALLYTTAWGIMFFGMPATLIVMLLEVVEHRMSRTEATSAASVMLICELAIAVPLIAAAKWLSRPRASKWWEIWRV
jgi:hypothetical protein